MGCRNPTLGVALALLVVACGESDFESATPGTGGTGGAGPSGGAGGLGGSAGNGALGGAAGSSGPTPISVVQETPVAFNNTSDVPTLRLATSPSAGNAIIVGISCFSEVDNCTVPEGGVTDSAGNTYQRLVEGGSVVSSVTHGVRGYLFIAENIVPGDAEFLISVDPNGVLQDNQQVTWGALEVAGLVALSLDQAARNGVSCCDPSTTVVTEAPTSQPNELAVALLSDRTTDFDINAQAEAGWTQHQLYEDGSVGIPHSLVSRVLMAPGVVSHTWTHDPATRGTSAVIATFRGHSLGP